MLLRHLDGFKGFSFEGGVEWKLTTLEKEEFELHKKQRYHLEDDLILWLMIAI